MFQGHSKSVPVPKENSDLGLPMGIMHCFGRPMMRGYDGYIVQRYRTAGSRRRPDPVLYYSLEMERAAGVLWGLGVTRRIV
jgi:hypothetical protein